jgi:hypothetical protein
MMRRDMRDLDNLGGGSDCQPTFNLPFFDVLSLSI